MEKKKICTKARWICAENMATNLDGPQMRKMRKKGDKKQVSKLWFLQCKNDIPSVNEDWNIKGKWCVAPLRAGDVL